jgi:hypothetical protein
MQLAESQRAREFVREERELELKRMRVAWQEKEEQIHETMKKEIGNLGNNG